MHKYFILSLIVSIIPNLCLADNPRITRLMREKQAKMEQLEKCMGSSKGLKIAGISTLGLTAVGVAGNIAEAKAIQDYNDRIESTDKKIEKTTAEIEEKRAAIESREEAEEQAKKESHNLRKIALEDIARINSGGFNGDKAVSHGYMPERLPDGLRSQFANAMVNFISKCRSLIGQQYGIKEVSLSPSVQENWRQYLGSSPLAEDAILDDLNEHIIAECKITECNLETHTVAYDSYGISCMPKPGVNGGVAPTQPTVTTTATTPSEGTDCITEAKKKDTNAETAKIENGKCKIKTCATGKKTSNDGESCVDKPVGEWTNAEMKAKPSVYCQNKYQSESARACCMEIYKENRASSWDEAGAKCNCKPEYDHWENNKCTAKPKSEEQIACESVSGTQWQSGKCTCTQMSYIWTGNACVDGTSVESLCKAAGGNYLLLKNSGEQTCVFGGYVSEKTCNKIPGRFRWVAVNDGQGHCRLQG